MVWSHSASSVSSSRSAGKTDALLTSTSIPPNARDRLRRQPPHRIRIRQVRPDRHRLAAPDRISSTSSSAGPDDEL